jgi:hypothetical protein
MDAPVLTPDEVRELAQLRRRAYGPSADIASDPAALVRLGELESRGLLAPVLAVSRPAVVDPDPAVWRRRGSGPWNPAAEEVTAAAVVDPLRGAAAEPVDEAAVAEVVARGAAAVPQVVVEAAPDGIRSRLARWLRTVPPLGWIVVAAAVLIVAAVVWATAQLTALRPDVELAPLGDSEPPAEFLRQGLLGYYPMDEDRFQQFESIRTLEVWSADDGYGNRCVLVTTPGLQRLGAGGACAPPGLDPTYDLSVWPGLPDAVTDGLPQGSVIRFVLHGDRVHVWVREGQWRPAA